LFEVQREWTRNGIQRAIRLAIASKIDMCNAIREQKLAIACKSIEYQSKPLISFNIPGPLEEFIKHRADEVPGRRHEARHRDLVRELAGDQPIIICKVYIDLYI